MKKLLLAALFILCLTPLSFAQTTIAQASADEDDYPRGEFYVGYSHLRFTTGGSTGFNGFNASITGNVSKYVGLKFDVAGHYKSEFGDSLSVYNVLGGVQLKQNSREARVKPFAHALAGIARFKASAGGFGDFSETGFAGVIGGGLDIRAGRRFDVRAIQVDYNPTRIVGETNHNFRIGAGIVIH
jgi:hypothetical protein